MLSLSEYLNELKEKKANLYLIMAGIPGAYFASIYVLQEQASNFYWYTIGGQTLLILDIAFIIIAAIGIQIEENI